MIMKRSKEDNRGFSLIELVIVMVIMAILVGIAGVYIFPYIRKSKEARDVQKMSAYCTDAMNAYISSAEKLDEKKIYTITVTKGSPKWRVDAKDDSGTEVEILKMNLLGSISWTRMLRSLNQKKDRKLIKLPFNVRMVRLLQS